MELDVMKLEDNQEYAIIDTIEMNNNKYLVFSNIEDEMKNCIRKVITKDDGQEYVVRLDTEKELELVIEKLIEKHKGEFK